MKFIVVGCGRIGSGLAVRLAAGGHEVAAIDPRRTAFDRLPPDFRGRIIEGIGFDRRTLLRAGIEGADGLAAATSDDTSNVIIGRIARHLFKVPHVVARMCDTAHAELYQVMDVPTISTVGWSVGRLEQILVHPTLASRFEIGSGEVAIYEWPVPPAWDGQPAGRVAAPGAIALVGLVRGGISLVPGPDSSLQSGDVLVVSATRGALARLEALAGEAGGGAP